jgi:hypothetical protein
MIALGVVVRRELPDCVPKQCRSEEDHPVQTLLFNLIERKNRSAKEFKLGDRGGSRMT